MKKFNDFEYKRPDMAAFKDDLEKLLLCFETSQTFEEQSSTLELINEKRSFFDSMRTICSIRHTIDTSDDFYEKENDYFDEQSPYYEELGNRFYKALTDARFKKELQAKWGEQLFTIAELSQLTFRPEILESLEEENKLRSEYVKLKGTAKLEFRGETYNLSTITPFETDGDRATRKEASEAKWKFYAENADKIEGIYDKLVKVRHKMALSLGYKSFVELGYARMLRSDYNAEMVANFRNQVLKYVVPIAQKLIERQAQRIGISDLKSYDEGFHFKSGNPKPKGEPEWIVENARVMYNELSKETGEFFEFMMESGTLDLVAKPNKAPGGYCTYIPTAKTPFIYSNFNGTSGDIDVLTHEAGHAFQVYESRDFGISEYHFPTYEACEIHSMSMEYFTWPWMNLFFKEDTDKYKFSHLSGMLLFLPYGVAVDEFQHAVYENPEMTPTERNATWRSIEKKYLPHRDYDGNAFLEAGGLWQRQAHIIESPFYYIDYTLAGVCALQFWLRAQTNFKSAWADYIHLCKAGGSLSFLKLVELANLRSPFEDGIIGEIAAVADKWLGEVDDRDF